MHSKGAKIDATVNLIFCSSFFELLPSKQTKKYTNENYTPLYIACQKGWFDIVKYLVEVGETTKKKVNLFLLLLTPMHTKKGKHPIEAKTTSGSTSFYIASQNGHLEILKYLVSKGVYTLPKVWNYMEFDLVVYSHPQISPLIRTYSLKINNTLHYTLPRKKDTLTFANISLRSPNIQVKDKAKKKRNAFNFLRKKKKTQVDAVTTDNSSPLYIACQHGHLEVVKYLCSKGANSEIRVRMFETQKKKLSQKK